MRRAKSELIVPIRDRRQHRRILTLKNFRNALIAVVALAAGITIAESLRSSKSNGDDYGRLYASKLNVAAPIEKKSQPIQPPVIIDATAADPTLVAAQARAQILTGEADAMTQTNAPQQPTIQSEAPLAGYDTQGRLVVVGGPEGVALVQQKGNKPVLRGGFGRQ